MDNNQTGVPVEEKFYKSVDIAVTAANSTYSVTYDLDKTIGVITGFKLTSNREPLLYNRGSVRLEVNRLELIPEGWFAKNLYSTANVPVNERFLRLGKVQAGNGQVKIQYTDTNDANNPFEPYIVRLEMDCELKEHKQ